MQRPRHVSLNDLVAHWLPCVLEVTCGCTDRPPRQVPLVPLTANGGGRRTLGAVIARLRCLRCHLRPVTITLREAVIKAGATAPDLGWSFPLPVPAPAPPSGKYNRRGRRVPAGVDYWLPPVQIDRPPESGFEDFPDIG